MISIFLRSRTLRWYRYWSPYDLNLHPVTRVTLMGHCRITNTSWLLFSLNKWLINSFITWSIIKRIFIGPDRNRQNKMYTICSYRYLFPHAIFWLKIENRYLYYGLLVPRSMCYKRTRASVHRETIYTVIRLSKWRPLGEQGKFL